MSVYAFYLRFLLIITGCLLIFSETTFSSDIQTKYPRTIVVIQTAYKYEQEVVSTYQAYAQEALSEGYPNISYLFTTIATSESIHARNFRQLLTGLGVEIKEMPKSDMIISSTKKNLGSAADREIKDIDVTYPLFIEQIKPESYKEALQMFKYTLGAEKQHRDYLEKIRSGTGIFFGLLAKVIESKTNRYFICHVCGALADADNLPKDACPICHTSNPPYKEVKRGK
jgi:rubrerythrin